LNDRNIHDAAAIIKMLNVIKLLRQCKDDVYWT